MINDKKYNELLDTGLILDHYLVLCNIRDGIQQPKNRRIQGFINLLTKKGYISEEGLTEKGMDFVADAEVIETVKKVKEVETAFTTWAIGLHKKLQDRLIELTGKKQVRAKIKGTGYAFLLNEIDLAKVLQRFTIAYKVDDREAIERCLMNHIQNCYDKKDWFPLVGYYIMKDNKSWLYTDLTAGDEEDSPAKSQQKFL